MDVGLAGLDGQGALAGGRRVDDRVEEAFHDTAQAQAVEAGGGQQDGVSLAIGQLGQAGVDVAAQHDDLKVRPGGQALGGAAQGGGAEAGALGQVFQCLPLVADEGVAGVFALGDGGDGQAGRHLGRDVLHRVDGGVDAAVQQGFLDLLGEQRLAADFQQAAVLDAVAGGGDLDQRGDLVGPVRGAKGGGDAELHHA